MYTLLSEPCVANHIRNWLVRAFGTATNQSCGSRRHTSYLTKYKPETKSWEDVTSFDHLDLRDDFCIVANDNSIYFIGGMECCGDKSVILTDFDRFELSRKQCDKTADTQMAKRRARGAALNKKIYITEPSARPQACPSSYDWEVYDETTNEWQIITGVRDGLGYSYFDIMAVDGELHLVDIKTVFPFKSTVDRVERIRIKRYYPEKSKWQTVTKLKARCAIWCYCEPVIFCSMRIFKGLFNMRQVEAFPFDDSFPAATTTQPSLLTSKNRERKCFVM